MSVKILSLLLMIFATVIFSGCTAKKEVVYMDRIVEVKIPTKCETPKVECNFNKATDTEVLNEMRYCIEKLKKANGVCK